MPSDSAPARLLLAWSGGKDSAMALRALRADARFDVVALLTTITADYDRISMHGVRRALLERQAAALCLPVEPVMLSAGASNDEYEEQVAAAMTRYRERGVTGVAFGDIFLADLRDYRERQLSALGLSGVFPLWQRDTAQLARAFIEAGFRAVITTVDPRVLDRSFAGRDFDAQFLTDLPAGVDACGENGEFHSFVHAGPIFSRPIAVEKGVVTERDGFVFCDLLPGEPTAGAGEATRPNATR